MLATSSRKTDISEGLSRAYGVLSPVQFCRAYSCTKADEIEGRGEAILCACDVRLLVELLHRRNSLLLHALLALSRLTRPKRHIEHLLCRPRAGLGERLQGQASFVARVEPHVLIIRLDHVLHLSS